MLNENDIQVSLKNMDDREKHKMESRFLDFISDALPNQFYHCGRKYEFIDGHSSLIPTKEKLHIKKKSEGVYLLSRTNEYKSFAH